MKALLRRFARGWFLCSVMTGFAVLAGTCEIRGAQGAVSPQNTNPQARAEWVRLLINRLRGDAEADAAGGVDGIKDGGFGFHTERQKDPWWQVDLQQSQPLDRVLVFNRSTVQERARNLVLLISADDRKWQRVYKHDGSLFEGPRDKKPLEISLEGADGRFIRIQIDDNNWLHLSEVEVYGVSDKKKNLALHKPALQSSVSQWSRRAKVDPATIEFGRDDIPVAGEIIDNILNNAGPKALPLRSELDTLTKSSIPPDDARWVSLYSRAAEIVEARERLLKSLKLLNIEALKRAINDLARTFPDKYTGADEYLARIERFEKGLPTSESVPAEGDEQARMRLAEMLALKREVLLANPLLDFDRLLLIKRSANRMGLPANWQGNCSVASTGYDNEIAILSPVHPDGRLTTLYRPAGSGFVGDVDLSFDADRMLFSMPGSHGRWQIWEIGTDGKGLREVIAQTEPDVDNYDACYLPDGRIIYGSTAPMTGVPCVRGSSNV
ncbi:MAG: discoidin domain-containing protein, partial [Dehalococcoidales bacterium]